MTMVKFCTAVLITCSIGVVTASAEKELMYDPVMGIVFVDKKDGGAVGKRSASSGAAKAKTSSRSRNKPSQTSGLHVGRKKDPPELYFKSGLEYLKNGDYNNALKNFRYADSLGHSTVYRLFIGKTLRRLDKAQEMIKVMFDILKNEPEGDVADDALLELALYYKLDNDYDRSAKLFTRLVEQYPFGTEYSTGEELPVLARTQRRLMRAELINMLTTLGFSEDDLQTGILRYQKARDLPSTGFGDQKTVQTLRTEHRDYLLNEEKKAAKLQQMDSFRGWMYGAIAAGGINIVLLLVLLFRAQAYRKHIAELGVIISELDVKNI